MMTKMTTLAMAAENFRRHHWRFIWNASIFRNLAKVTNHRMFRMPVLKAYGFSNQAFRLLQSYFCNRFQRNIINGSFVSWNEVITGVPQGSILGPLLFNIFLNDIFLFISKCQLCNYADDNTLYKSGKNIQKIKNDLEMDFMILRKWFHENHMVLNPDKCNC